MDKANYETIIARLDAIEARLKGIEENSSSVGGGKEGKKPKRVVKPKDPDAPKRPPNWYFLMKQDIWKEVDKEGLSKEDATKKKNEQLAKMKDDKKAKEKYEKEAEKLREKYNKEKEDYDKTKVKALADKDDSDTEKPSSSKQKPVKKEKKKSDVSDSDTSTSKKKKASKKKSDTDSDSDVQDKIDEKRDADIARINALANSPSDESD